MLILSNAKIYTQDANQTIAQAIAIQPLPDGAEVTREVGYVSRGTGMNAVIRYDGEDITYDHRSKSRKLGGGAA